LTKYASRQKNGNYRQIKLLHKTVFLISGKIPYNI
jgi:hypothetical protein